MTNMKRKWKEATSHFADDENIPLKIERAIDNDLKTHSKWLEIMNFWLTFPSFGCCNTFSEAPSLFP